MSAPHRERRVAVLRSLALRALLAALASGIAVPLAAYDGPLAPVGLTTEGAQLFDNHGTAVDDGEDYYLLVMAAGDFNGDGAQDLAIGAPLEFSDDQRSGRVELRYGHRGQGLVGAPVMLGPGNAGYEGTQFGAALAAGDFDGDGFDDLAVGMPAHRQAPGQFGAVLIYYGSAHGLGAEPLEILDEVIAGGSSHVCAEARFGSTLAVGNFNGDARDDLAIGVYDGCEEVAAGGFTVQVAGGSIYVAEGTVEGLVPFWGYWISQESAGIEDQAESYDQFGAAFAAGDFNGDHYDDLAIGVPGENDTSGAVEIVMGHPNGLIFANSLFLLPNHLAEDAEAFDGFGAALAAGDYDGDGHDDLAIGVPGEGITLSQYYDKTGAVDILYGISDNPWFDFYRIEKFTQAVVYWNEAHEGQHEWFGQTLAAADIDGDGRDDLAIGHPGDNWPGTDHGAVTILMGHLQPYVPASRHHLIGTGWEGVPGDGVHDHWGGSAIAFGDFDGSDRPDLAIGMLIHGPQDPTAGAVVVLYDNSKLFADGFESGVADRWSGVSP